MATEPQTPQRYGAEPLYDRLADDYSQRERPFTVTVAGPERHDGERPTTYVLDEFSTETAWARVLAWHMAAEETPDCYVVAGTSFEGVPSGTAGFHWNDLRPELQRQRDLDDLADQAAELVRTFDEVTSTYVDDSGKVQPERRGQYERAVSQVRDDGWGLIRKLSTLDGRD